MDDAFAVCVVFRSCRRFVWVLLILLILLTFTAQKEKIDFKLRLSLCCRVAWVSCCNHMELMNQQRSFTVRVDPRGLPTGEHYAEVGTCLRSTRTA